MNDNNRPPNLPDDEKRPEGFNFKSFALLAVFVLFGVLLISAFSGNFSQSNELTMDSFMSSVYATFKPEDGDKTPTIKSMKIDLDEQIIKGEYNGPVTPRDGKKASLDFTVRIPANFAESPEMATISRLNESAAKPIQYEYEMRGMLFKVLVNVLPWILMFAFIWFFLFRQLRAGGGAGGVLSFGKSRARLVSKEKPQITFSDVAGIDEACDEVREIVEFLKNPRRFQRLGGRIPRGVMLVGPPGTGKTLLARAIAGEAAVPFFSISGSDFVEMFVGVGASRVRDLFAQAKESSPSIIFLDEIDAVGRRRGTGMGGGHDEREQTLNAILVEMDGFETDQKVIVIAATNRSDVLDPALLRPGRFDRHVYVDLPDVKGREEILRVHASDVHLGDDVDLKTVAKSTPGFSGADLENLINEAALIAVLDDHDSIFMSDIEKARDKVLFGRAKNSRVIDPEEKLNTAYHEAGHATVAYFNPKADNPHKITVIPHGKALGMTSFLPEKERLDYPKKRLMAILEVAYGGRVAEELFCDDISAGAENDIQRITDIARKMVTSWGMSDKLGPLHYDENSETMFLGRDVQRVQHHSDAITQIIDEEIKALTSEAYKNARALLAAHEREMKILAQALFEVETINYEDMVSLFETGRLPSAVGLNGGATTTDTPAPSAPADPFSVQPIEPKDTTPDSADDTTPA